MFIQHIKIRNFGSIVSYDVVLTQELNLIDSRYIDEIAAAIRVLLCNKTIPAISQWLQEDTRISAIISLANATYTVCAKPQSGRLQLLVTDPTGADATARYQQTLSHCTEQDAIEAFDGQDKTIPLCLYQYRFREDCDDLSGRTQRLADTETFRRYLYRYIQAFRPEPINSKKNYQTAISPQGKFEVCYPGLSCEIHLSETEQRLFWYICFLNIAAFWANLEKIRDLHHEKKPLVIRNFLEFLDESTDFSGLIARTLKLYRQVIILTPPLDEETKKRWIGEQNA